MKKPIKNLISILLVAIALADTALSLRAAEPVAGPSATPESTLAENPRVVTPLAAPDEDPWQFGVTVPLWAPQIDGNATVKGHKQDVNISFNELKDHLDASFALGLSARKGKFGLFTGVGYMKFSAGSGPVADNLKFLILDAGMSYQLIKTETEHPFILEGTAGIRYWGVWNDLTLRDAGGTVLFKGSSDPDLVDPVIGLRGSQYLTRKLHLDLAGDVGGFNISHDTDMTWSVTGLVTYDFARWFSLSAGYRALGLDVSEGSGANKNGLDLIFNGALITANFKF